MTGNGGHIAVPPLSRPALPSTADDPLNAADSRSVHTARRRTRSTSPQPLTSLSSDSESTYNQRLQLSQPKPAPKRRRRAPSPSHWIPHSLLAYNLSPSEGEKSSPVPLPPVFPLISFGSVIEERNSYDENFGFAPYGDDWNGTLPGPGLGPMGLVWRDGLCDTGGYVTGRLRL
jgi:hypothetical protein